MQFKELESFISESEIGIHTKDEMLRMAEQLDSQIEEESDEQRRDLFAKYRDHIKLILDDYRSFKKNVCFSNIRKLLKSSDVKIGQIEHEAGFRAGYMSRLEKEDNTSEPSIEFVVTAAKMLDVSVDFLINTKVDELTPAEDYVLKFLHDVNSETKTGKLLWEREAAKKLNGRYERYGSIGDMHPLFMYTSEETDNQGQPLYAVYCSRFFPECRTEVMANAYHAKLSGTSAVLYVVPCMIYEDEDQTVKRPCYELYIYDREDLISLCNTTLTCAAVSQTVKDLYNQIQAAASHVQITDKARGIIDRYMNRDSLEDNDDDDGFMNIPDAGTGAFMNIPLNIEEELPFS